MKYLLFILSAFYCYSAEISGPENFIPQEFDVIEYAPTIRLDNPESKYINGVNRIIISWDENTTDDKFYFHARGYQIDSVFYEEVKVDFTENLNPDSAKYHFSINRINTENTDTLYIYYSGVMTAEPGQNPWGGVHYEDETLYAMGVGFKNNYVSTTQHWLPCYDLPHDKAKYNALFIIPRDLEVISNGVKVLDADTLENMKAVRYVMPNPSATYLLTFAVGEFKKLSLDGQYRMNIYTNDEITKEAAETAFSELPEMIESFEYFFGDYPFNEINYYTASKGAMEHQTLITMDENQVRRTGDFNDTLYHTAAHELAHQWFGNMVTPYDFRDAWLNESFATYCEALWLEYKLGKDAYFFNILSDKSRFINSLGNAEGNQPLYDFDRNSPSSNYPGTIYHKGSVVLAMLRAEIANDSLFFNSIREYLNQYSYENVNTKSFTDIFDKNTEVSSDFWDKWIYSPGWARLDIELIRAGENSLLKVKQLQDEGPFDVFVGFDFVYEGGESDTVYLRINQKTQEFKLSDFDNLEVEKIRYYREVKTVYLYEIFLSKVTDVSTFEENISVFPNPTKSELNIKFDNNSAVYSIEIVTLLGNQVFLEENIREKNYSINIDSLAKGTYYVIIRYNSQRYTKKIMVN